MKNWFGLFLSIMISLLILQGVRGCFWKREVRVIQKEITIENSPSGDVPFLNRYRAYKRHPEEVTKIFRDDGNEFVKECQQHSSAKNITNEDILRSCCFARFNQLFWGNFNYYANHEKYFNESYKCYEKKSVGD